MPKKMGSASDAAIAGVDQPLLQLAHFLGRLRRDAAEALQSAQERLSTSLSPSAMGRPPSSPTTSSRRRSSVPAPLGASAIAPAVDSSVTKMNPSTGISSVTLYLDLDDLANPEVPDRLHDDRAQDHHLAHVLVEQQRHVVGVDERQRDGQRRRQRQQHPRR